MSFGGDDFDIFQADTAQFAGDVIGSFLDVGLVLFKSADARNTEKIFEFVQETLLITAGKVDCGRGHNRSFRILDSLNLGEQRGVESLGSEETNQYSAGRDIPSPWRAAHAPGEP